MKVYRIVDERGDGMYRSNQGRSLWSRADIGVNDGYEGGAHPPAHNDGGMVHAWPAFCDRHGIRTLLGDVPSIWDAHVHLKAHRFGFGSLQQLRRWVYGVGWLSALHEAGGRVQVYEVPDEHVLQGTCQVTFNLKHAERVLPDLCLIDLEY
jgi:hypothetical protein